MASAGDGDDERLLATSSSTAATSTSTTTSSSGSGVWGLRRSLFLVLGVLVALVVWSIGAEYSVLTTAKSSFLSLIRAASGVDDSGANALQVYPPEVFATDWSKKIPYAELLHVTTLHTACVKHKDAIIPWDFGIEAATPDGRSNSQANAPPERVIVNEHDDNVLETLRQCPDVDVFIPGGIRSYGYCEDAAVYTKCTSRVSLATSMRYTVR